jgi:Flp pilus assembly protein TadD
MRDAAERAVALDPLLAEAHAALGLARARSGDWELAEASFRRAIALDPNDATALTNFVMWHLNVLGRNEEALALLRRAESADPLGSNVQLSLAWVLMSLGRFAEADGHCRRLPASHELRTQCLGRSLEGEGRHDEAVRLFTGDPALSRNPQTRGFLGYALARSGRRDDAERMANATAFANEQALIFAGLGDTQRTLDALGRMSALGAQRLGGYLNYPEMAALHGHPQLVVLRRQAGLPQ